MDSADDFVVVDEENMISQKMTLDRLSVLVDLFSKALDAVNQSNILLKDELCSALSVTLQNIGPDASTSIDNLVKALESNVTSTDEVRANYTRRLCSRLVAVNEEKQALLAELVSFKESVASKEKESSDQLNDALTVMKSIFESLCQLERFYSVELKSPAVTEIHTADDLTKALTDIHDRLVNLHLTVKQRQECKDNPQVAVHQSTDQTSQTSAPVAPAVDNSNTACSIQSEVGMQTSMRQSDASTQCHVEPVETPAASQPHIYYLPEVDWSVSPQEATTFFKSQSNTPDQSVAYRLSASGLPKFGARLRHLIQDVTEGQILHSSSDVREQSESPSVKPDAHPSFSAQEEEPWCPCCGQTFDSRDDLESHLHNCLQ